MQIHSHRLHTVDSDSLQLQRCRPYGAKEWKWNVPERFCLVERVIEKGLRILSKAENRY